MKTKPSAPREAVLGLERRDRLAAVAERAEDHGHAVADPGVFEDSPRDLRVLHIELERVQVRPGRHRAGGPQRAVAAVRPELEKSPRLGATDRGVEDLSLLVADVDQELLLVGELVDRGDRGVEVAGRGVCDDVLAERRLTAVADLPLGGEPLHPEPHADERPPQERKAPSQLRHRTVPPGP